MTLKKLREYQAVCRQIKCFEEDYMMTMKAVDTTKEIVQNSKISKPTEDVAIKMAIGEEYHKLVKEKNEVLKFIVHIQDNVTRDIVLLYIKYKNFEKVGEIMKYHESTVRKKLCAYLKESGRNE